MSSPRSKPDGSYNFVFGYLNRNYQEQVELHLFRRMPDPTSDPTGFERESLVKIKEYTERSRGRTSERTFPSFGYSPS